MIDNHQEYRHGLASDARLQHVPPSSSLAGYDFTPQPEPDRQYIVWIVLAAVLLIGGSLIASIG